MWELEVQHLTQCCKEYPATARPGLKGVSYLKETFRNCSERNHQSIFSIEVFAARRKYGMEVDRLYMFKEGGVEVDGWTGRRNRRVVISGIKWTLVSQMDDWKSRTKISVLAASLDVIMLWSIRKRIGLINCKITAAI
ncbi:hypothetical protein QQG55_37530 [Brugia pahangi]